MPKRYSTVEIVNGKVVFSDEVLSYFESIRNDENSEWIDEYFKILSNSSNIDSKKSRGHHIIPCLAFKDENHPTRNETEPLANKIKGNVIELSIYNHILVHRCLWKIFKNNKDAKIAYQRLCKQEKIENLTDEQIDKIAKLIEECAKENVTEKERKAKQKKYDDEHKEESKARREKRKDEIKIYMKHYYEENKEELKKRAKIRKENNKEIISEKYKIDYHNNKEKYKAKNKLNYNKHREDRLKKQNDYDNQMCYDPIARNSCTLNTLNGRKRRHKELYENVIPTQCIIKN